MARARKGLSAKTRFEVFKRDGFVCMYCGAHPPAVILHVDHIVAVVAGGRNDMDNLVTSCDRCNLGKGARDLTSAPQSLAEKALETQEREAQLRGYYEVMEAKRRRLDEQAWDVVHIFDAKADSYNRARLLSIKKFIELIGYHEVAEAADIAMAKITAYNQRDEENQFRYFCGVCWSKARGPDGEPK